MRWMWIDRVVELEPRKRVVAIKNVSMAEEHLHDHFAGGVGADGRALDPLPLMPGSLIVEGMAQAAGVLVGHAVNFGEKVALAKVSRVELEEDVTPGMTLRYTATMEQWDKAGASTAGTVEVVELSGAVRTIGRVDLMFSYLDNNFGGTEFPKENFVFGDSFRTLLRMSGVGADF